MSQLRRSAGLIAALILALTGGVFVGGSPLLGGALLLVGLGAAIYQARQLFERQPRADPYDLNRLWEQPAPEPDDDAPDEEADALIDDDGTVYCYGCGHAVPPPFARCPECGRQLR